MILTFQNELKYYLNSSIPEILQPIPEASEVEISDTSPYVSSFERSSVHHEVDEDSAKFSLAPTHEIVPLKYDYEEEYISKSNREITFENPSLSSK